MRTVGIIPARMNSERFPGKVLAEINFRPMIQWVYAAAIASDLHHVCVATDSDKIYRFCVSRAMNCHKTDQHETGSDRVAEVANKHYDADIVFNLQCDEPLLKPYMINNMIDNMIEYEADVETLGVMMHSYYLEMFKRNVVKVVHDEYRFAKQFARRIYPWEQFGKKHYPKQHVGIYAFKKQVLKDFIREIMTLNYENEQGIFTASA